MDNKKPKTGRARWTCNMFIPISERAEKYMKKKGITSESQFLNMSAKFYLDHNEEESKK